MRDRRGAVVDRVVQIVKCFQEHIRLLFAGPRGAHLPQEFHLVQQAITRIGKVRIQQLDHFVRDFVKLMPAAVIRGEFDNHASDFGQPSAIQGFENSHRIDHAKYRIIDVRSDPDLPRHRAMLRTRGEIFIVKSAKRPELGVFDRNVATSVRMTDRQQFADWFWGAPSTGTGPRSGAAV